MCSSIWQSASLTSGNCFFAGVESVCSLKAVTMLRRGNRSSREFSEESWVALYVLLERYLELSDSVPCFSSFELQQVAHLAPEPKVKVWIICLPGILCCPELCSEESQQLGKCRLNWGLSEEVARISADNTGVAITTSTHLHNARPEQACWVLSISQPKSVGSALGRSSEYSLIPFLRSQNTSGGDCLFVRPWINSGGEAISLLCMTYCTFFFPPVILLSWDRHQHSSHLCFLLTSFSFSGHCSSKEPSDSGINTGRVNRRWTMKVPTTELENYQRKRILWSG